MTTTEVLAALRPVREALLRRAEADAERCLAAARTDAAEVVEAAEREAADLSELARARGAAEADEVLAAERAAARRTVRSAELAARTVAYDRLRTEVVAALRALSGGPDYPILRERLAAEARRVLGDDAEIVDAPGGGVYGRTASGRVDCSLDAFAERAVAALGPELDGLWSP
jgi:vacuolar-type H+-ATPase subunit E/Vma4